MPIYYGSSKDGSDMKEFEGFYISENGKYWGNQPVNNDGTFKNKPIRYNESKSKYHK